MITNFPIAVLLSDTHLFEKRTKQDTNIDCNFELVKSVFQEAINQAKKLNLEYVFHAGDFFDSRKSISDNLLDLADEIFSMFEEQNIKLILIQGNHDRSDNFSERSFLRPFRHFKNVQLVTKYDFLDTEKVRFHFLSFFENEPYIEYLEEIKSNNLSDSRKNVLITHIGVHGALKNDGEKEVSSVTFEMFKEFDKTLIGHYHNYSSHVKDRVVYFGSAFQQNFGEDNKKGIIILDNGLRLTRIKTNFKEYETIVINVEDINKDDIADLISQQNNTFQRIFLTGKEELLRSFDKSKLTNYGIKVELKADKIEIKEVQRRLNAYDEKSILENFSSFCKENQYDEQEGLLYLK